VVDGDSNLSVYLSLNLTLNFDLSALNLLLRFAQCFLNFTLSVGSDPGRVNFGPRLVSRLPLDISSSDTHSCGFIILIFVFVLVG
jgi:hypothetical protein